MEFLFHGTNHVLINEILCDFYTRVLVDCEDMIEENQKTAEAILIKYVSHSADDLRV